MKLLISALIAVGLLAAGLGVWLTVDSVQKVVWMDVGKALMTFGATVLVGGAVAAWLKLNEQQREVKEAWAELLQEIVEAHQKLAVACQLVNAHKTAKTYSEQNEKILEVRATLRRVYTHPLVAGDRPGRSEVSLDDHLNIMKGYVDDLGLEYEGKYLSAARQQRIDEQYLKVRIEQLVGNPDPTMDIDPRDRVYYPTKSWEKLEDAKNFVRLNEFIKDFQNSCFQTSFEALRDMLAKRAGIVARSPRTGR